jgi:hypothetical protein
MIRKLAFLILIWFAGSKLSEILLHDGGIIDLIMGVSNNGPVPESDPLDPMYLQRKKLFCSVLIYLINVPSKIDEVSHLVGGAELQEHFVSSNTKIHFQAPDKIGVYPLQGLP